MVDWCMCFANIDKNSDSVQALMSLVYFPSLKASVASSAALEKNEAIVNRKPFSAKMALKILKNFTYLLSSALSQLKSCLVSANLGLMLKYVIATAMSHGCNIA